MTPRDLILGRTDVLREPLGKEAGLTLKRQPLADHCVSVASLRTFVYRVAWPGKARLIQSFTLPSFPRTPMQGRPTLGWFFLTLSHRRARLGSGFKVI